MFMPSFFEPDGEAQVGAVVFLACLVATGLYYSFLPNVQHDEYDAKYEMRASYDRCVLIFGGVPGGLPQTP
jgi:hypothetical protein